MSNKEPLQQLLDALPQAEPSAALDHRIMGTVEKLLYLEKYYQAEQLLSTQHARLDAATRSNLETGMSKLKAEYGSGFEAAYSDFVIQQNALQAHAKLNEPEPGRR